MRASPLADAYACDVCGAICVDGSSRCSAHAHDIHEAGGGGEPAGAPKPVDADQVEMLRAVGSLRSGGKLDILEESLAALTERLEALETAQPKPVKPEPELIFANCHREGASTLQAQARADVISVALALQRLARWDVLPNRQALEVDRWSTMLDLASVALEQGQPKFVAGFTGRDRALRALAVITQEIRQQASHLETFHVGVTVPTRVSDMRRWANLIDAALRAVEGP